MSTKQAALLVVLTVLAGCRDAPMAPADDAQARMDAVLAAARPGASLSGDAAAEIGAMLVQVNTALSVTGAPYRASYAEYLTAGRVDHAGNTVLARDLGNRRSSSDYVPFDERREGWSGPIDGSNDNITYAVDRTGDAIPLGGGLSAAQTDAAIAHAMGTWDRLTCSALDLTRYPDFGLDIGVLAFDLSGGVIGSPFIFADIQHAGFRDLNFAGATLAVTVTFVFIDDSGDPTDVNADGKDDTAFAEIYYDPSWLWRADGVQNIDVESVAVHEAGHGLSQLHFGSLMLTKNEFLIVAPFAVMNAGYVGPQQELHGSDVAGHCNNWSVWPAK